MEIGGTGSPASGFVTLKLLIDMNLSPDWVDVLRGQGWSAVHWSTVGDRRASDQVILNWAAHRGYTVFTHDLDFGAILAASHAVGPSVIQVRVRDVLPDNLQDMVITALKSHISDLSSGALLVVDFNRSRIRILPI